MIATDHNGLPVVPTKSQLALFNFTNKLKNGPQLEPFLLDLEGPSTRTPWNKKAGYIFAAHFAEQPDVISVDTKTIREVFKAHLLTLSKQYHSQIDGPDMDDEQAMRIQEENTRKAKYHRQRLVRLPSPPPETQHSYSFLISSVAVGR